MTATRPRSRSLSVRVLRALRSVRSRWSSLTTSERRLLLLVLLAVNLAGCAAAGLAVGSSLAVVVFGLAALVALYRAGVHGTVVRAVSDDA